MKPLILTWLLACGADATTTVVGVNSGRVYEAVLPTQNPAAITALLAGQAAATSVALITLHHAHPRLARVLGWTLVGARVGVVAWNVHQLAR